MDEIKNLLTEYGTAIAAFKSDITARLDDLEKRAGRPALFGKSADGRGPELEKELKALGAFIRTGDESAMKALQVGVEPDGGYLVLPSLSASFTKKLYDMNPVRRLARREVINTGDTFEEPVDRDEAGASWVSETASRPATTTPQLGKLSVTLHEIYALQPVTQKLLDDSYFDIGGWVEGKIADKFGRSEGAAFVNGTGVGQPRGFMTYDVDTADDSTRTWGKLQYVKSGSASVISDADGGANGIVDLYWSLRAPYRANGTWLMASSTANALDKLKDNNKDYIWRAGMTAGAPPSLLGRPVEFCEEMPAISGNAYPVVFADFSKAYMVLDRPGIKSLRDPYSAKPYVHFYAYRRVGGDMADFDALKLLKIAS